MSIHESLYTNRVRFIHHAARRVNFGDRHISLSDAELQRFELIQVRHAGQMLASSTRRTAKV